MVRAVELAKALCYKGMMLADVPNFLFVVGYTNASWTLKSDLVSNYACRLLNFMQRHGYDMVVAERDPAVNDVPIIDFSSGYVQRAIDQLPKQGDRKPWGAVSELFEGHANAEVRAAARRDTEISASPGADSWFMSNAGLMRLDGRTAVVTGAASGIGRALAVCLARRGCHLALADLNEAGAAETAEMVKGTGRRVTWHALDVANRAEVAAFPEAVLGSHAGGGPAFQQCRRGAGR